MGHRPAPGPAYLSENRKLKTSNSNKETPMPAPIRTSAEDDHRRRPRAKRTPSSRDQAIFVAYRATGRSQAELAIDYRLSQRRISAIIERVARWAAEGQRVHSLEAQHLARWLEREQAQAIYERALRAFDYGPRELKTVRKGDRDGKPFEEETCRELAPSAQLLRAAIAAKRDLTRLANQPPLPLSPEESETQRRASTLEYLTEKRDRAWKAGKVAFDPCNRALMKDLVRTVAGEPNDGVALAVLDRDAAHRRQVEMEQRAAGRAQASNYSKCSNPARRKSSQAEVGEEVSPTPANSHSSGPDEETLDQ